MHVPTRGRIFGRSDRTRGDLFDFGFESASFWENCTCEGKYISGGVSALVVASGFLVFPLLLARLCRALPLSLRSHVLAFDRLRRAIALVFGDRFVLE